MFPILLLIYNYIVIVVDIVVLPSPTAEDHTL